MNATAVSEAGPEAGLASRNTPSGDLSDVHVRHDGGTETDFVERLRDRSRFNVKETAWPILRSGEFKKGSTSFQCVRHRFQLPENDDRMIISDMFQDKTLDDQGIGCAWTDPNDIVAVLEMYMAESQPGCPVPHLFIMHVQREEWLEQVVISVRKDGRGVLVFEGLPWGACLESDAYLYLPY